MDYFLIFWNKDNLSLYSVLYKDLFEILNKLPNFVFNNIYLIERRTVCIPISQIAILVQNLY